MKKTDNRLAHLNKVFSRGALSGVDFFHGYGVPIKLTDLISQDYLPLAGKLLNESNPWIGIQEWDPRVPALFHVELCLRRLKMYKERDYDFNSVGEELDKWLENYIHSFDSFKLIQFLKYVDNWDVSYRRCLIFDVTRLVSDYDFEEMMALHDYNHSLQNLLHLNENPSARKRVGPDEDTNKKIEA